MNKGLRYFIFNKNKSAEKDYRKDICTSSLKEVD